MNRALVNRLAALAAALLLAPAAQAQLFRAYLSSTGNDNNACTLAAPCRLLPRALSTVADKGEIWMLDSANYNTGEVAIDKSVTIEAVPGAMGSIITQSSSSGLFMGTAGIHVILRNLRFKTLVGAVPVTYGIVVQSTSKVTVEKCRFAGFSVAGISLNIDAEATVTDSSFLDSGVAGIAVGGNANATIIRSLFEGNASGVEVRASAPGGTLVRIHDSHFVRNDFGVDANLNSGTTQVQVTRSTIQRSTMAAVRAYGNGGLVNLYLDGNTLLDNAGGYRQEGQGSQIFSYGNNSYRGNGSSTGTLTQLSGFL